MPTRILLSTGVDMPPLDAEEHGSETPPRSTPTLASAQSSTLADSTAPPELPRTWKLPAKNRPGRKPSTDVPMDKRKASNRDAQRAFRMRRRMKEEEATKKLEESSKLSSDAAREMLHSARRLDETRRRELKIEEETIHLKRLQAEVQQQIEELKRARGEGGSQQQPHERLPQAPEQIVPSAPAHPRHPLQPGLPTNISSYSVGLSQRPRGDIHPEAPRPGSGESLDSLISPFTIAGQRLPSISSITGSSVVSPLRSSSSHGQEYARHAQIGQADPHRSPSSSVPPSSGAKADNDPMEIDFTSWRSPSNTQSGEVMPEASDYFDKCGFCQDLTYCQCNEARSQPSQTELDIPQSDRNDSAHSLEALQYSPAQPIEPQTEACGPEKPRLSGPGNCENCQKDPVMRKMCIDLAQNTSASKHISDTSNFRPGAQGGHSQDVSPHGFGSLQARGRDQRNWTTCDKAITLARERDPDLPHQPYYENFIATVQTAPHQHSTGCVTPSDNLHCSPQDVEIASILRAMSQRDDNPSTRPSNARDSGRLQIRDLTIPQLCDTPHSQSVEVDFSQYMRQDEMDRS